VFVVYIKISINPGRGAKCPEFSPPEKYPGQNTITK
jgi:hypothetical protein